MAPAGILSVKNEMEWIQSLTQLNGLTQPLMFLVIDSVLYLSNNEIEIELVQLYLIVGTQTRAQQRAIFALIFGEFLRLICAHSYSQFYNGKISCCCVRHSA